MKKIFVSAYSLILIFYAATARAIYNPSNLFVGNLGDNSFQGIIMFIIQNIFLPIAGTVAMLFIIIFISKIDLSTRQTGFKHCLLRH